jgi:hypothetical protein
MPLVLVCTTPPEDIPGVGCNQQQWMEISTQQELTLDKSYFPDLSPSEVLVLTAAIWVLFASAYAWKFAGRVIRE